MNNQRSYMASHRGSEEMFLSPAGMNRRWRLTRMMKNMFWLFYWHFCREGWCLAQPVNSKIS
ncbi:hypothetical protein SB6419_01653 [Klebsiella spallanzanii]|nr:hypothetical protein SB6419_01653 [Klebsiella spallanzanii]